MNIFCPNCENGCSEAAAACPKCGHPLVAKNSQDRVPWKLLLAGAVCIASIAILTWVWSTAKPAESVIREGASGRGEEAEGSIQQRIDERAPTDAPALAPPQEPRPAPDLWAVLPARGRSITDTEIAGELRGLNMRLAMVSNRFWELQRLTSLQAEPVLASIRVEARPLVEQIDGYCKGLRGATCRLTHARIEEVRTDGMVSASWNRESGPFEFIIVAEPGERSLRDLQRGQKPLIDVVLIDVRPSKWLGPAFAKSKERDDGGTRRFFMPRDAAEFPAQRSDPHVVIGVLAPSGGESPDQSSLERAMKLAGLWPK